MLLPFYSPTTGLPLTETKDTLTTSTGESYPIINEIPRFVPSENYAYAFGLQWNKFSKTQLDSFSKTDISKNRLIEALGLPLSSLKDKLILEAGCGSGRFTEILLDQNAYVHALDYSNAVDAHKKNIGIKHNLKLCQASLLEPPFKKEAFDLVLCLGVLQHLPSPEAGICSLFSMVKPGGQLIFDNYKWKWTQLTLLSPLYRKMILKMDSTNASILTDKLVKIFFPLHWKSKNSVLFKKILRRFSPVLEYISIYPELSKEQHYEWARLDTHDSLTDRYKHLMSKKQMIKILKKLRINQYEIIEAGNGLIVRMTKN